MVRLYQEKCALMEGLMKPGVSINVPPYFRVAFRIADALLFLPFPDGSLVKAFKPVGRPPGPWSAVCLGMFKLLRCGPGPLGAKISEPTCKWPGG